MIRYKPEGLQQYESSFRGRDIPAAEAKELRKQLADNPDDLRIRLLLLWRALRRHSGSPLPHLVWLIDNHPRNFEHCLLHLPKDDEVFKEARRHWLRQLRLYPEDVTVICHAASFVRSFRHSESIKLLRKAATLDADNDDIPRELSFAYRLKPFKTTAQGKRNLRESVQHMKRAVGLYSRPRTEYSYLMSYYGLELSTLARDALSHELLQETEDLANLLLQHGKKIAEDPESEAKGERIYGIANEKFFRKYLKDVRREAKSR